MLHEEVLCLFVCLFVLCSFIYSLSLILIFSEPHQKPHLWIWYCLRSFQNNQGTVSPLFFLFNLPTLTIFFQNVTSKTPVVYGYIALQLNQTNKQFRFILEAKKIDQECVLKGLKSLTKGLHKIKMPLFLGAIFHLIQYWGEIFGEQ